jgi:hypothetical protein
VAGAKYSFVKSTERQPKFMAYVKILFSIHVWDKVFYLIYSVLFLMIFFSTLDPYQKFV